MYRQHTKVTIVHSTIFLDFNTIQYNTMQVGTFSLQWNNFSHKKLAKQLNEKTKWMKQIQSENKYGRVPPPLQFHASCKFQNPKRSANSKTNVNFKPMLVYMCSTGLQKNSWQSYIWKSPWVHHFLHWHKYSMQIAR